MTAFTRTWNATYKSIPEDDDDALEGASHIRNVKIDVAERMGVDHYWDGDANDGKHRKLTFRPQAADPALDADEVSLYAKAVGSKTELFFKNEDGNVIQMTFTGQSQFLPAGCVIPFAGTVAPGGFVFCYGQALSRTTYAALFAVIGTTYGAGDGVNTFNVPDIRGRVVAGADNMGGVAANRLTIMSGVIGAAGGVDKIVLALTQIPSHDHAFNDPGHSHQKRRPANFGTGNDNLSQGGPAQFLWRDDSTGGAAVFDATNASGTGITHQAQGGGQAHDNVQPTIVMNYLIKT